MYSSALHSTPILAVSAATGSGQRRASSVPGRQSKTLVGRVSVLLAGEHLRLVVPSRHRDARIRCPCFLLVGACKCAYASSTLRAGTSHCRSSGLCMHCTFSGSCHPCHNGRMWRSLSGASFPPSECPLPKVQVGRPGRVKGGTQI